MAKAKVFEKDDTSAVGSYHYCVDGMHVYTTHFLGRPTARDVTACDSSCTDKPAIQELECPAETVYKLREKLDKGMQNVDLIPVG